jgi:hypothetical protein
MVGSMAACRPGDQGHRPYSNLNRRMLTFINSPMPIIMVMIDEPP